MTTLEESIRDDIRDRGDWMSRQEVWYQIRHQGIRRINKPYPGAPDLHFPLVDSVIEKHKPFYVQQIYATETLATFVPRTQQQNETTSQVGQWFDYQVKQASNFEREIICGIDTALQNGGSPIKVFWNTRRKRLEFDACDPLHVIVPKWTEELQEADRLTHVLHLSEAQYRANPNYRKDPDFIKAIKGRGGNQSGTDTGKEQEIARREGLTCGQDDNQIVLWEIYTRDTDNWNKVIVKTRSPLKFDEPVRADFAMPYTEGVFKEGAFPFVKVRTEIKDKGYYSSRGISEILAPFETSLNKTWNFIHEWMDFFARPRFKKTKDIGNLTNFNSGPGAVMPEGIEPEQPPQIPDALRESMNSTRELAESRVQAPDMGLLQRQGKDETATGINAIMAQSSQGSDLRARVFRLDLGDIYRMAWALLLQYGKESLIYAVHGAPQALDAEALQDCYEVTPNGSADSWNKGAQMAKAQARFAAFKGDPFINQGELRKTVLENDDAGLVKRLYVEPKDTELREVEDQHVELLLMNNRFAAHVDETDNDTAHLQTIAQWFPVRMQEQPPLDPIAAGLVFQHIQEHGQAMYAKKDPMAKQLDQVFKPISAVLQQIAAQAQQNVVPMEQEQSMPEEAMV